MTKGTKTVLIIAASCIALSVVLLVVGAMLGGTRFADGIDTEVFGVNVHMGKDGIYAGSGNGGYSNSGEIESVGFETVATFDEDISAVEISWVAGSIDFIIGGDVITVKEECFDSVDSSEMMSCRVENGTLKIGYSAERITVIGLDFSNAEKHLTVTVPEHLVPEIKNIRISATSADVSLSGFEPDRLSIGTTSGNARVSDIASGDLVFESTNGNLTAENCAFGKMSAGTTSGSVTVTEVSAGHADFDVTSGDVTAKSCSFGKVEAESTSGSFSMSLNSVPSEFDADTTSGDVELILPADAEFELEFDRTSGDLELEFASVKRGDEYVVGSGRNEFSIETTSGDAIIRIK